MPWPLSQDYNEAIQSPASNFADPDLRGGETVVNALGLPMPYSGTFADVYQIRRPHNSRWAVKCFTREVPGLCERYQVISRHLKQAGLPFTVDFVYLEEGIRVLGRWHPVLKMRWVEGLTLNQFLGRHADKPAVIESLVHAWARMARRLREGQVGHGDLQHGNVLLVRGADGTPALKLIDYDGMWTPMLAGAKAGEIGHPAYQHPRRTADGGHGPDVDRFPLLLVATALCTLKAMGRPLWDRYDDGDNLLFKQADLRAPTQSPLFHELVRATDPRVASLADRMIQALRGGFESTPLLEEVLPTAGAAPAVVEAPDYEPSPPLTPDWLRELAAAVAAEGDLTNLRPPPPAAWLPDVSRGEQALHHPADPGGATQNDQPQ